MDDIDNAVSSAIEQHFNQLEAAPEAVRRLCSLVDNWEPEGAPAPMAFGKTVD